MTTGKPLGVRQRLRELAELYGGWETDRLVEALAEGESQHVPMALTEMRRELERRQCPKCGVKRDLEAAACGCGHGFLPPLPPEYPVVAEELRNETAMPFETARQLQQRAYLAVVAGFTTLLMAVLWSVFYLILPFGITIVSTQGVKRVLKQYPGHAGASSAQSKAQIGLVMAWTGLALYLLSWVLPGLSIW